MYAPRLLCNWKCYIYLNTPRSAQPPKIIHGNQIDQMKFKFFHTLFLWAVRCQVCRLQKAISLFSLLSPGSLAFRLSSLHFYGYDLLPIRIVELLPFTSLCNSHRKCKTQFCLTHSQYWDNSAPAAAEDDDDENDVGKKLPISLTMNIQHNIIQRSVCKNK